jgi:hypothetical protein
VHAFFKQAEFHGTTFSGKTHYYAAHFDSTAHFVDASFCGAANFGAAIGGEISFAKTKFGHDLNLSNANLKAVIFDERGAEPATNLQFGGSVTLDGFKYDSISVDWVSFLGKMEPYERQAYSYFENFLRSQGQSEQADNVYYRRKCVEGNRIRPKKFVAWLWDRSYRLVAGYGVRIWPLVFIPVLLLFLGTAVFSRDGSLVPNEHADGTNTSRPSHFDAFAVSLHYLTHMDLPSSTELRPSRELYLIQPSRMRPACWPGLHYSTYATLQVLLGSLVVPFVIATIVSRLRHKGA